jgi:hypothetical protein
LYSPEAQAKQVVEMFTPIKERVLVWLMGNHEYTLSNISNFAKAIADGLESPYGSAACSLKMQFHGKKPIKFFLATSRAKDDIQREANKKAALKGRLAPMFGDCVGMFVGHGHDLIAVDPTAENNLFLSTENDTIKQNYRAAADQSANYIPPDSRWYGMAGSFLRLYSPPGSEAVSYGEMKMYSPLPIGCLVATIRGGKMVNLEKLAY